MAHVSNPDKLAAEADKYGPLQDDTAMVEVIGDDSDSKDERVCAVSRGVRPKRGKGEEQSGPHHA